MQRSSTNKFILSVFVFSWVCWGIAILTGQPSTASPTLIFYMLGGSGPTLVALFYLFRYFDKAARREFWSRLVDVRRIRPVWWFLCLLGMPVLALSAIALDAILAGALPPTPNLDMLAAQPVAIPIFVLMMFVGGALSEELGWRGIVLEAFQREWTPLRSTLTLSLVWCMFHLPLFLIPGTAHYRWGFFSPMFLLFLLNVIPIAAYLTLGYNHNRRSILTAILSHFSYNLVLALFDPISTRAFFFLALFLFLAVAVILKQRGWTAEPHETNFGESVPDDLLANAKS